MCDRPLCGDVEVASSWPAPWRLTKEPGQPRGLQPASLKQGGALVARLASCYASSGECYSGVQLDLEAKSNACEASSGS